LRQPTILRLTSDEENLEKSELRIFPLNRC
jgi:hypothetical protein